MSHTDGTHGMVNLLPEWLGVAGVAIFLLIAIAHLRHLAMTSGERGPWHACHVLMAIGMAFMYAPAALDLPAVSMLVWRVVFAVSSVLTAIWALGAARRVPSLIWLLTAVDLGAMVYMWSPDSFVTPLTWALVAYLTAEAGLWTIDAYRRVDGSVPIIGIMTTGSKARTLALAAAPTSLLGDLNLSASMIGMTLGMAYMFVAMQLTA